MSGGSIDASRFFNGGTASGAFVNPLGLDFWPSVASVLRNNADASYAPGLDFNERSRSSPYDVGAYETDGVAANPGWKIIAGPKLAASQTAAPAAPRNLRVL
jgi:hypothetical protein